MFLCTNFKMLMFNGPSEFTSFNFDNILCGFYKRAEDKIILMKKIE